MAAILQLRQGSTSTYISQGPNIAEPFFDTGSNILIVGKSATEVIKLTKLDESNAGSFSITGDYTGSNLYLSGDLTASNANLSGDITIGGNIILGDAVQDNITISGQFDSDLIPSASATYDLGSTTKKWNNIYAVSASIDSIDIAPNLPSGVISGSAQISLLGYDNYGGWYARGDNNNDLFISAYQRLYFTGRNGIITETLAPGNEYVYFDLDTGSAHFTDAVAGVGAPAGTVSGSQQVIDLLPSGVVSGSSQINYTDISNIPSGIVSGSSQVLGTTNIVSSSTQVIQFLPQGTISGSTQILDGSGILSSSTVTNFDNFSSSIHGNVETNFEFINNLNAISHSHSNKVFIDTVNQDLGNSSDVTFNNLHIAGTGSFANQVTIYGNLTVFGTESIVNSENLAIADNMIYLNSGSSITNPDLGWVGNYNDGTYAHAGIFRDASDGKFKFFEGYTPEPEGSIDTSHGTFSLAAINVGAIDVDTNVTALNFIGTGSQLVFDGTNIVSSSQQVINFLPSGLVSGSTQITNGSNLVSSSQQVINFLPSGTISGSTQVLGGTSIVSSSNQVITYLPSGTVSGSTQIIEVLEVQTPGLVSGSDQVTASLDTRYATLGGNNLLSSSNENFSDYSQSVDTRLLNTLSSGSATSQSLYTLVGNFPTSGSLGTAAFYNVSSSLADDPSTIPNVKAVYDYINNVVQAADITGVSASFGLFGGGNAGYVSLSLDTGSTHFTDGVQSGLPSGLISSSIQLNSSFDLYGGWYVDATNGINQYIGGQETVYFRGNTTTNDISTTLSVVGSTNYVDFQLNTGSAHFTNAVAAVGAPAGTVSGSQQVINLLPSGVISGSTQLPSGLISGSSQVSSLLPTGTISGSSQITDVLNTNSVLSSSNTYIDANDFSFGGAPANVAGLNQFTLRDDNAGYSGLLSFQDGTTTKSFDYVSSNVRYIDTNTGVSIAIKPDADGTKSWVFDTDGDLVSNGGSWNSGNLYSSNVIARNAVTSSYMLVDYDITADTFIGTIAADNGVVSGSSQVISLLPSGVVSGSQQIKDLGFVDLSSTQTISGTKTFNDIVVNGTGSFAYIESVAGSAKIIGDAFIVLNNDTPTERYAGLSVYDSGSANTTASLQFDGQTNDWFYQYSDDGGVTTDHGVVLFGPEYSGIGSPTYPTNNRVQKGNGGHHLLDSNITDNGTTITLGSNTNVSGVLTATQFTGMISGSSQVSLGGDVTGNADVNTVGKIQGIAITSDEATQLANIGTTTISATQWGYLGSSDQGIATSDDVTFNTVSATGDIVAYASSDRRLKDEIQPISDPISKINQIGGYSFIWNSEKQNIYNGKDYGVIAQEIEEILPELVQNRENGYKAVKYDKLVSLLIEGIKELSKEVEDLKKKIN